MMSVAGLRSTVERNSTPGITITTKIIDADLEVYYAEQIEQYEQLNARDSIREGHFIIDCPRPIHLGSGWQDCSVPACLDCNDTVDSWSDDPRIYEARAKELATGERSVRELVTS